LASQIRPFRSSRSNSVAVAAGRSQLSLLAVVAAIAVVNRILDASVNESLNRRFWRAYFLLIDVVVFQFWGFCRGCGLTMVFLLVGGVGRIVIGGRVLGLIYESGLVDVFFLGVCHTKSIKFI